jgi:hypothetical protein
MCGHCDEFPKKLSEVGFSRAASREAEAADRDYLLAEGVPLGAVENITSAIEYDRQYGRERVSDVARIVAISLARGGFFSKAKQA